MNLRLTTFNLENLFNRYFFLDEPGAPYEKQILPSGIAGIDQSGRAVAPATTLVQRNNTARAILECEPDVLAVQEVEDLRTLRSFNDEFLDNYFDRLILLAGNDSRGINVGLCIRRGCKATVAGIRTHADELTPEAARKGYHIDRYFNTQTNLIEARNALFSRDCLEVDLDADGTPLTLLVNHLKSQSAPEKQSDELRTLQAERVAQLVGEAKARGRLPVVMGDMNYDWTNPGHSLKALRDLVDTGVLVDPFASSTERVWTHYYAVAQEVSRLDYILVDSSLGPAIKETTILRKALTLKCKQYTGERYPTIGYVGTEASDHCPASVAFEFAADAR